MWQMWPFVCRELIGASRGLRKASDFRSGTVSRVETFKASKTKRQEPPRHNRETVHCVRFQFMVTGFRSFCLVGSRTFGDVKQTVKPSRLLCRISAKQPRHRSVHYLRYPLQLVSSAAALFVPNTSRGHERQPPAAAKLCLGSSGSDGCCRSSLLAPLVSSTRSPKPPWPCAGQAGPGGSQCSSNRSNSQRLCFSSARAFASMHVDRILCTCLVVWSLRKHTDVTRL